jgi:hypothetical protein
MEDFLLFLAEKKFRYYRLLYKLKPQAYTNDECYERIEAKAKYEEVMEIINGLPFKEEMKVKEHFEKLLETV